MLQTGIPDSAAQATRRARVVWNVTGATDCVSTTPGSTAYVVCKELDPGETGSETITFRTTGEVNRPRLVIQTSNAAAVVSVDSPTLEDHLPADTDVSFDIDFSVPPGIRARQISARVYMRDRNAVLVPPLNVRLRINHPRPDEVARTPVVVPTTHVRILSQPLSAGAIASAALLNVRTLRVTSGMEVTWTNKTRVQRSVYGVLCDSTAPVVSNAPCEPDAATIGECDLTIGTQPDIRRDASNRILCFMSQILGAEGYYVVRVDRPSAGQPLTYRLDDALNPDALIETIGSRSYYPYMQVR